MSFWYPVYGHPSFRPIDPGVPRMPWYRVEEDLVLTTDGHPSEPPDVASFRHQAELIYPIDGATPWFERDGSMIYTLDTHPFGWSRSPWYQVR